MANYKDFAKHDPRRLLLVLFAIERLGPDATTHYLAQELSCARMEVQRAVESARKNFLMEIAKHGSTYQIDGWGILDPYKAKEVLESSN